MRSAEPFDGLLSALTCAFHSVQLQYNSVSLGIWVVGHFEFQRKIFHHGRLAVFVPEVVGGPAAGRVEGIGEEIGDPSAGRSGFWMSGTSWMTVTTSPTKP